MSRFVRVAVMSAVLPFSLALAAWPGLASAADHLSVAGFVNVPGTNLELPLGPGASPVTIQVTIGIPAVQIPIEVTHSTAVVSQTGRPVTLTDGDRVKINGVITGDTIRATKLELEEFPEIEVRGTATGLPAAGLTLPVPADTTVSFKVTVVPGVDVPVVLTSRTKIHGQHTVANGDTVRIDAVLKDGHLVVTEISVEG